MVKDKRFVPVEYHEPVEEDTDFEMELDDEDKLPRRKGQGLYIAS